MSIQDLTLLKLAECGDFSGLHLYLEQNSNVNVNYQSDKDGTNALIACVKGSNILPASESPVEFVSCGRLLVESGTDINAQDIGGRTALHWAVSSNNAKFVENLLEAGADTTLLDENGDAVIHLALSTKEKKCLQAICGHISTLVICSFNFYPIFFFLLSFHVLCSEIPVLRMVVWFRDFATEIITQTNRFLNKIYRFML